MTVDVQWFYGFALGVTWAFDSLWVSLGPMQLVFGRAELPPPRRAE